MQSLDEIANFINKYSDAKVGIDAPLKVDNEIGNREVEKAFLRDYSSKKLGVYPVNRRLLEKNNGYISGEILRSKISQVLGKDLFEVYPHVTILECLHKKVLPYKRKVGRDTDFIKEQLNILQNYLLDSLKGDFAVDIFKLKGKALKIHEDKLDSIVAAYTLYYCNDHKYKIYEDIFLVPNKLSM